MKILAGHARGRIIKSPAKQNMVRPILARIKKSVFDIITPRLAGANFLDLFAGTGSVGLEALSRGASQATFIEQDRDCLGFIQENANSFGFRDKVSVVRGNVLGDLSSLNKPFDLIFIGAPYKDQKKEMLALTEPTLLNIEKQGLLKETGLVIAQHHKKEKVEEPSPHWELARRESYGDSVVSFFKWRT